MSRSPQNDTPSDDRNRRRQGNRRRKTSNSADAKLDLDDRSVPRIAGRDIYAGWAVCGLLLLAVAIVFGQTVSHGFTNFDDPDYVYKNDHVRQGLTLDGVVWAMTTNRASNWHPVTWLSHMADGQFFGLRAGGHHLTSVLIHAATAVLLFLVLWQMTGNLWPSAFVAAVFAVHPLHVESVAWVSERKDVLSGLFFVLTLAAYLRYVHHAFSIVRYLTVAMMFALGLMAKPMLVTLPFVLLLLDYWPLGRMILPLTGKCGSSILRRLVVEKLPLLLLSAASCVITPMVQGEAVAELTDLSLSSRIANALVSYVGYMGKSFLPIDLAAYYPHPLAGLPMWKLIVAFVFLASITAAVVVLWRKNPYLLVGWLWYLGMLVPVIGLVQVGMQAMADRYMYLPQIGLSIAATWGALYVVRSWRHRARVCGTVGSLTVVGLMICASQQAAYWRDSETLWRHTLRCTSGNALAHYCLGLALVDQGQLSKAIEQYEDALRVRPDYTDARSNLGVTLASLGRWDEAVRHLEKALATDPHSVVVMNNLGLALAGGGHIDAAIRQYRNALETQPDNADVHVNLGLALANGSRPGEAISEFQIALKIQADCVKAHSGLADVLAAQGKMAEAIQHLERVVELQPDRAEIHSNLGVALASLDRLTEAIEHYRKALKISPDSADTHFNLGVALAKQRQTDQALVQFRQALDLANRQNNRALAEAVIAEMRNLPTGVSSGSR
jgi:protein O-mannosyl-transferase